VVAGGGICGLTAALHSARLGMNTLLLTGDVPGGHLLSIDAIEGFPGYPDGIAGYELCPLSQGQAVAAGAEVVSAALIDLGRTEDDGWRVVASDGEFFAIILIIATGTAMRSLDIPGAARLAGKGVSHCASCDAPLMRGRTIAVVGGGDSALQEALTLAEFAAQVNIFHLGNELTAQRIYRDRAVAHPKIEIHPQSAVEEILGDDGVTGLRVRNRLSNTVAEMEATGVFAYIGLEPNTAFLKGRLKLDASGRLAADGWMRTDLPGIFAAGTVRSGSAGRAIAAAGEGARAALAAERYLRDRQWPEAEIDAAK
jgi:thioredoxin reductase (NADPH)